MDGWGVGGVLYLLHVIIHSRSRAWHTVCIITSTLKSSINHLLFNFVTLYIIETLTMAPSIEKYHIIQGSHRFPGIKFHDFPLLSLFFHDRCPTTMTNLNTDITAFVFRMWSPCILLKAIQKSS